MNSESRIKRSRRFDSAPSHAYENRSQCRASVGNSNFAASNRTGIDGHSAHLVTMPKSSFGDPLNDPENPRYGSADEARVVPAPRRGEGSVEVRKWCSEIFEDTADNIRDEIVPRFTEVLAIADRGAITPGIANWRLYPVPAAEGVIWYPCGSNSGPWGFVTHQPIFYYGKCPFLAQGKGRFATGFQATTAAEQNGHPCPKPIDQMNWIVNRASLPGGTVLDPFMGSGTTLRAAKDLGRKAIGIEIEEKYCEIAARRMEQEVLAFDVPLVSSVQPELVESVFPEKKTA